MYTNILKIKVIKPNWFVVFFFFYNSKYINLNSGYDFKQVSAIAPLMCLYVATSCICKNIVYAIGTTKQIKTLKIINFISIIIVFYFLF